jgi:glycosyltransferase involved in cell wall biosynthesis
MNKPLTIAVDGRELQTKGATGIGRYLQNFLQSQVCHSTRHRLVVLTNMPVQLPEGSEIRVVPGLPGRLWDQITLPRELRRLKADVLFSPYDKAPFVAPCPVVATFHDLLFLQIPHLRGMLGAFYGMAYQLERRCLVRTLHGILTVSEHTRRDLVRRMRLHPSRIRITYNGIPSTFSRSEKFRKIPNGPPGGGYLLYVGNFKPHKNVARLLQAFGALDLSTRERHPLVLAGDQTIYGGELKQITARESLPHVYWTGQVSEEDLPLLYSHASLFVFPSLAEGFGLPPLEAMACGCPVLAARSAPLPEVLGNAAHYFDGRSTESLTTELRRLLECTKLRAQLAEAGVQRASRYPIDETASRIMASLEAVVCPTSGSRP